MTKLFFTFTENNDHEGEAWRFYIPATMENLQALYHLMNAIDDAGADDQYEVDFMPILEKEVDVVIKHSDSGYMAYHNKLSGTLTIPADKLEYFRVDGDDEFLYKGEIRELMKG